MINLRKIATLFIRTIPKTNYTFSDKTWKERDESAEKVYISQAEKQSIKKLLKKVEQQEADRQTHLQEFERKLHQIAKRYRITDQKMLNQIVSLHENLTK